MNIDKITEAELKQKVMKMMEDADDKVEAIYQAAAMIVEEKNKELINQLVEQNARAAPRPKRRSFAGSGKQKMSLNMTTFLPLLT